MAIAFELIDVSVVRSGRTILDSINWSVDDADRWVVIGPNGSGKTTLLNVVSSGIYPTSGTVHVLGETLGRTNVFELRPRIGFASSAAAVRFPAAETVMDVVMTAAYAVTGRWHEQYDDLDQRRASRVLHEWRLTELADRRYGTLSDGEKKRVQIARAIMTDPELLLLDEPCANLDLGAREEMIALLGGYAQSGESPAMVMVTHLVEEIPPGTTHALILSAGRVVSAGPLTEVLTSATLSDAYGVPLEVTVADGRYTARGRH